jgi:hypothetical protein
VTVVGWLGTGLYLFAQLLLATSGLSLFRYVLINAIAALACSAYSLHIWSIQPAFINVVWTVLSLIGLRFHGQRLRPFGGSVDGNRASLLLITAGIMPFLAAWWLHSPVFSFWLSWLSFWIYSAAYFTFMFVGLGRRLFLTFCIVAAAAIIPQLAIDANYPVLFVQALWIVFSAVGLLRRGFVP